MADATKLYVSGPAYLFTGTGASFAWEFIGFSESGFGVAINSYFEDVPADYAAAMPADVQYMGQDARISGILARYDEAKLQKLVARIPSETPGSGSANILGSLMVAEGGAYPILVYSPYSQKTAFSDMVPCWNFAAGYLAETFDVPVSIRVKKPNLIMRCLPVFGSAPFNTWTLYTNTPPSPMPATN